MKLHSQGKITGGLSKAEDMLEEADCKEIEEASKPI